MKRSFKNKTYWFFSNLVENNLRAKGYRLSAQYIDVFLTLCLNGFRINDTSTRCELACLRKERRMKRMKIGFFKSWFFCRLIGVLFSFVFFYVVYSDL